MSLLRILVGHLNAEHSRSNWWLYADSILLGWMGWKLWGPWWGLFS